MRKRRSGRIAINPVPPYIPNTPKGAGLTDVQGRPLLSFYLIKPAKINLSLCARSLFPPAKDTRKQHVHEGIIYTVCLHNACARTVLFGLPSISVEARFGCPNKRGVLCIRSWRRRSSRRRCSSSASRRLQSPSMRTLDSSSWFAPTRRASVSRLPWPAGTVTRAGSSSSSW